MEKTIRVLYKPAGKPFEVREIPNTLEACQELVGGYIEMVTVLTGLVLVCNEEGLIRGLPSNPFMGYDFRGDFFLCGVKGEDIADVPEMQAEIACKLDSLEKRVRTKAILEKAIQDLQRIGGVNG